MKTIKPMSSDSASSPFALGAHELTEALRDYAATDGAKKIIAATALAETRQDAERLLSETEAMIELVTKRPDFDIAPFGDIPNLLVKAKKSKTLSGAEIVSFGPLLNGGHKTRALFIAENIDDENSIFVELPIIHGLAEMIEESLDNDGAVLQTATPEIERLTKSANSLRQSIREKAEALLKDVKIAPILQDTYVTLRENRFVLPVKAEHKNHIEGILHDSSNSGQTFFIEPKVLVELNNRLKAVEMELGAEIEKLLAALSVFIADEAESITIICDALIWLDVILARAKLSLVLDGVRPRFGDRLNLLLAAHPVMLLEGKAVVRNGISLPIGAQALIISGPNAGGKTVTLKTVGLLAIMARAGLFITAKENSILPFYRHVYADIGDSQSIHDDLSTFSAHVKKINEIVTYAKKGSLVLLDELMVSTDPKEGSALGAAVLDRLISSGADIVVTTHFHELKILAQSQPGFFNAAMEFDREAGLPTYRMVKGAPGASSALAVAKRLGMDSGIIAQAKATLDGGDVRIETALEELAQEKSIAYKERREAEKLKKEAKALTDSSRQLNDELKLIREEIAKTAKTKLRADIADAKRQIAAIVEEARSAGSDLDKIAESAQAVEEIDHEARIAAAPEEKIDRANLVAGDTVYIVPLERSGKLENDPAGGEVKVLCGSLRVTVKLADIIGTARAHKASRPTSVHLSPQSFRATGGEPENVEIDLRGLRAEEAIDKTEKFIDELVNRQVDSVRIIHGKGTGALRAAIREYLENSRYKASYRSGNENEGGDGVTVVTFW